MDNIFAFFEWLNKITQPIRDLKMELTGGFKTWH